MNSEINVVRKGGENTEDCRHERGIGMGPRERGMLCLTEGITYMWHRLANNKK